MLSMAIYVQRIIIKKLTAWNGINFEMAWKYLNFISVFLFLTHFKWAV